MAPKSDLNHSHLTATPGKEIKLKDFDPAYTDGIKDKKQARDYLKKNTEALSQAQELLWASSSHSILIIFQAMDAAGKDGTIKHVMSGINPQGCVVYSFKAPAEEDKMHHFLWRPMRYLPARGKIAIFNRSYYEEVLVVRVHPHFLDSQWLDKRPKTSSQFKELWKQRYRDICHWEKLLHDNGTFIIKFFLNVSPKEQKNRFLERLNTPEKQWKFSEADFEERKYWDDYQKAYEDMINATSTEYAPWHIIPADHKWFMRTAVSDIITTHIKDLDLSFPKVSKEKMHVLEDIKAQIEQEK